MEGSHLEDWNIFEYLPTQLARLLVSIAKTEDTNHARTEKMQ